jgi:hypothetical protein
MDYSHRRYDPPIIPIIDEDGQIMAVTQDELTPEDTVLHPATADYELAFEVMRAWRIVAANANDYFLGCISLDSAPIGVIMHRMPRAVIQVANGC